MTDQPRKPWDVPPLYFLIALIGEIVIGVLPGSQFIYYPWQYLGVVFILLGLVSGGSGAARFRKIGTPLNPREQPTVLVTAGPYRFTRNPMYLGLFLILVGTAFLLQRLLPFVLPFLFAWLVSRRFIQPEEERLHAQFGTAYDEYVTRVRRWV
jgi:protein-S-isoprenylcysteine O-methyltransferase Ste14